MSEQLEQTEQTEQSSVNGLADDCFPLIDVIIPLAPGQKPTHLTLNSLYRQEGVILYIHESIGPAARPTDHRIATISRSRNIAKEIGYHRLVLFLDSDVILPERNDAIRLLVEELLSSDRLAAVGYDYENSNHVKMGCVLWDREALKLITFKFDGKQCECLTVKDDLEEKDLFIVLHPDQFIIADTIKNFKLLSI